MRFKYKLRSMTDSKNTYHQQAKVNLTISAPKSLSAQMLPWTWALLNLRITLKFALSTSRLEIAILTMTCTQHQLQQLVLILLPNSCKLGDPSVGIVSSQIVTGPLTLLMCSLLLKHRAPNIRLRIRVSSQSSLHRRLCHLQNRLTLATRF